MNEEKRKQIEARLKKMIELDNQARQEQQTKSIPRGTRAIRRRQGTSDKYIL
jgi:hypothetical protein